MYCTLCNPLNVMYHRLSEDYNTCIASLAIVRNVVKEKDTEIVDLNQKLSFITQALSEKSVLVQKLEAEIRLMNAADLRPSERLSDPELLNRRVFILQRNNAKLLQRLQASKGSIQVCCR